MNKIFFAAAAGLLWAGAAQAQTADSKALVQRVNQLMRNPDKPHQDVQLTLDGCHATYAIRDNKADVNMSRPVAVSYNKGQSGWSVNMADGFFEYKMDFDWSEVAPLRYERSEEGEKYYQVRINRTGKNGKGSSSFNLTLRTTDEAVARDVTARLEKLRQGCQ